MNNHFFKIYFLLLLFSFFYLGCNNVDNKEIENYYIVNNDGSDFNKYRIGEIHNEIVSKSILNYPFCDSASNDKLSNYLREKYDNISLYEEFKIEKTQYLDLVKNSSVETMVVKYQNSTNISQLIDEIGLDDEFARTLKQFLTLLDQNTDLNVSSIQNIICKFHADNSPDLSPSNRLYLDLFCDVGYHSCELWMPINLGGMGYFKLLKEINFRNCNATKVYSRTWFCETFLTDMVGTVAGATSAVVATGGAAAIPNPAFGGMPTAGVIGVIQGVAASTIHIIGNL